jgi:hypothetical protein
VTVTGVTGVENVSPAYAINDEIWAIKPEGGTGIFVDSVELEWIDANVDGRHYRFPRRAVEVCVAGVARNMIIYGSAPV